jgi:hypothetical protein
VRLWDLSDPERPRAGEKIADGPDMALTPDGKAMAIWVRGKLQLLDLRTRKVLHEAELHDSVRLACSPDGRTLAVGCSEGVIRLYDTRSWRERAVLRGGDVQHVGVLAFSPDGQLLATNAMDWRVSVWEVASGRLRRRIERKASMITEIAFSPDGRRLAVGGSDPAVSVYDLATGRVLHSFRGHDKQVTALAFTPDGRRLLSGSYDTTILVWDMTTVPAPAIEETKRTAKELDALWERLAGDAADADAALRELAACPEQAAELAGRLLKPAAKDRTERIARLLRQLDSDTFAERERAEASLAELGEDAAEALGAALDGEPSAEVRRRAERLLERLREGPPAPERLRALRAVQLLEWIGSPAARRTLEALADGAPGAERTRAARAALECVKKR